MLLSGTCLADKLTTTNCEMDVEFRDNGAVRLSNIKGKCTVEFYHDDCIWGEHTYNLDDNETRRGDTFLYPLAKTNKVCVSDTCVEDDGE